MVSTKSLGLTFIALGFALPAIAYVVGQLFNMEVANFGGPPNQGAMVLAYLVFLGAIVVGVCLAVAGVVLLAAGLRKQIAARITNVR
jgi:hypothetical protein